MSDDDWAATNRPSTHSFDGIYDDDGESDGSYRSDDDYGRVCDGGDNGGGSSGNGRGKAPARLSPVVIQHDCSPCSLKSHVSGGGNGYDAFEQHDAQMTKEVGRLLEELNEKMYDVKEKKKKKLTKQQHTETAEDQENDEDGEPLDQLALDNKRRRNLVQRHNFETHRNPQQVHMVPKVEEWTRKFPHFRICGTGCLSISPAAMLATTAATTTASNQPGQEQDGDELEIATLPSLRPLVYRKSFSSTDDGSWSNNHASGLLSLDELCVAGKGMVCDVTQRDGVVGEESVVEIFAADGEYSEFILCDYEKGDDDDDEEMDRETKMLVARQRQQEKKDKQQFATNKGNAKKFNKGKLKPEKKEGEGPDGESKWRDRAKERRTTGDQDDDEPQQAAGFEIGGGLQAVAPPGQEQPAGISVEASKYLGGDMENTHRVKGLDFALLNKVRSDLDKQTAEQKSEAARAVADDVTKKPAVARLRVAKGILQVNHCTAVLSTVFADTLLLSY